MKGLEDRLVDPTMIEPMMRAGVAGYAPFCSVLHWIMTEAGRKVQRLGDSQSWAAAVKKFVPLISTGEVQIVGRSAGGPQREIEGQIFAAILVSGPPSDESEMFKMITGNNPWISCIPYTDEEHWRYGLNDVLYLHGSATASWTHLQIKKADVLREFSASMGRASEAKAAGNLTPMQISILEKARELWPTGEAPPRVAERNQAIQAQFGKTPPSERTIRRALKGWP